MSEVFIFPEMLEAGVEALLECRNRDLPEDEMVVAIYLAMEAIREIRVMRTGSGLVH